MKSISSPDDQAAREAVTARPQQPVQGWGLVMLLLVIALGSRGMLGGSLHQVALRTWATVFVAAASSRRWRRRCAARSR